MMATSARLRPFGHLAAVVLCGLALAGMPAQRALGQSDAEMSAAIDEYVRGHMRSLGIPGMSVGVVRGTAIAHLGGYGIAGPDGRPVTAQTPFHIASVSKPLTASAVLQMVEAGKLDLDAPVQRYLPWFNLADPDAAARITLRHLLQHTSGLSTFGGDARNLDADTSPGALERSIRELRGAELATSPGERFEYSNTNYDILGLVVQTVSGEPYEQKVRRGLFAPLRMSASYESLEAARPHGASSGHYPLFGIMLPIDGWVPVGRATRPSAGLASSAEDLSRWLMALLGKGGLDGATVLSPASVERMLTPGFTISGNVQYALGWTAFPFSDALPAGAPASSAPIALSHGGRWLGYAALVFLLPARDLGVVVLMNGYDPTADSAHFEAGWNIARIALGIPVKDEPDQEEWLWRYSRAVLMVGAGAMLALNGAVMFRSRRQWPVTVNAAAQLAVGGYVAQANLLPGPVTTLGLALRFTPDLGLLYIGVIALAAWAVLMALARGLTRRRAPDTPRS